MKGRVLVAGFATRHVAQSAARAGYDVCAVDHFCDQDLSWYTKDCLAFEDLEDLPDAVDQMTARHSFDMLVVTSGAEEILSAIPLAGTPKDRVGRFLDKLEIQHFFEEEKIPVPAIAREDEYPRMIKPKRGAGGWRNAIVRSPEELQAWESQYPDVPYIGQQVVGGVPSSVCCVTNGRDARAICTNEQILRGAGESAFGFSGSVTPFDHPLSGRMIELAEKAAAASGCKGTIGIDFVTGDDGTYAIEINPRFQGTLDTVDTALGVSLFSLHMDSCAGIIPPKIPTPCRYAARSIIFADRDMTVFPDLKHLAPIVADIPWPGAFFEKDQALVSVYGSGASRGEALSVLDKNISTVRQYMR